METGYEAHTKTTRCGGSSGVKGVAVPLNDSLSESKWKFTDSFPSSSLALPGLAWFSFSFRLAFRFFHAGPNETRIPNAIGRRWQCDEREHVPADARLFIEADDDGDTRNKLSRPSRSGRDRHRVDAIDFTFLLAAARVQSCR